MNGRQLRILERALAKLADATANLDQGMLDIREQFYQGEDMDDEITIWLMEGKLTEARKDIKKARKHLNKLNEVT